VPRVEWRLAKTKVAGSNPVFRSNVLKARSLFFAIVGGLHLFEADDARVDWTASELKRLGLRTRCVAAARLARALQSRRFDPRGRSRGFARATDPRAPR